MSSQPNRPQQLICPQCSGTMTVQLVGELQDKLAVCPFCNTTLDLQDSFQRVRRVRRERRGLFGGGEVIEEEVAEYRSDQPMSPMTASSAPRLPLAASSAGNAIVLVVALVIVALVTIFSLVAVFSKQSGSAPEPPSGVQFVNDASLISTEISINSATLMGVATQVAGSFPGEDPFGVISPVSYELSGHPHPVQKVIASPAGSRLVTLSAQQAQLWDGQSFARIAAFTESFPSAEDAAFSPDGQIVALIGSGNLEVRSAVEGELLREFAGRYTSAIAFSPDGETLVAPRVDGSVVLLSAQTGAVGRELGGTPLSHYNVLLFSPDGRYIVAGGSGYEFAVWEAATGTQTFRGSLEVVTVSILAFMPTGDVLAVGDGARILLFSLNAGVPTLRTTWSGNLLTSVRTLAYSPDGRYLAAANFNGNALLWEVATQKIVQQLGNSAVLTSLAFSADGLTLVGVGRAGTTDKFYTWSLAALTP